LLDQPRARAARQQCPANDPESQESGFCVFIQNPVEHQQNYERGDLEKCDG
jgi:hypothetical protein